MSQKLGGGKVDWKKARGEAVKGAITGAVQGGMVASGVKIPKAVANAANFLAGTIGSAAEQKIARGRVSAGRSILGGIANMVGNSKYGTGKLDDWKDAAVRGVKAGGLHAGLGYLADVVDPAPRLDEAGAAGLMAGMAGSLLVRNPGRCGSPSPFQTMLGYGMAKGYQYGVSQTGFGNRKRPSFTGFLCEGLRGAVTGGISSVAFYGLNKGIVKLWDGFWAGRKSVDVQTGSGYDAGDTPVRIAGDWTENDMKQALLGHPPRGLGSPDIHHGGQMPGGALHEIIPKEHRNNPALHPNPYNQGVTSEMRMSDRQLHWWYRAREQGADQLLPDWIYD